MNFVILGQGDKEDNLGSCEEETPFEDQVRGEFSRSQFKSNYISNLGPHSKATLKIQ